MRKKNQGNIPGKTLSELRKSLREIKAKAKKDAIAWRVYSTTRGDPQGSTERRPNA